MATPHALAGNRVVPLRDVERDTIPRIFFGALDRGPDEPALMHKAGGAWHTLTRAEVERRVRAAAAALQAAGMGAGDRVALLSENRPEWAVTDYAATGLGVIDVPIYPTLPANQVEYVLKDCGARIVFVSTAEQAAKLVEIRARLPQLERVVSFDRVDAEGVEAFEDFAAGGQQAVDDGSAEDFRALAMTRTRDEVATLIYTSGTTGNPKGVMLTHWNLASNVAGVLQHGLDQVIRRGDVTLSFLPLSHVFERMVDYVYWEMGACIAYAESMETVADNLNEVRPMVAVSVPRLFEKIHTRVTGVGGLAKHIVAWASRVGEAVADARLAGRTPPPLLRAQYAVADRLVFAKLRARTGGRLRNFVSGGAPLSAGIAKFFFAAGLPVYEGYGLTETSPVIAVNGPGAVRLGTVGRPIPGVEVTTDEATGEILTRGPHVLKGYWNNPVATAEAVDEHGWFHTGDIGALDGDGFLRITDRLKNIIVTAGGKNVAPQPMENAAAMSPFVAQALVIGDRRPFPSLLAVPDWENLLPWAEAEGLAGLERDALARHPRVHALLEKETLGRLGEFAHFEQPKKLAVIPDEFTIDAGLLTPSLKIRRKQVEERYRDVIEDIYAASRPPE